MDLNVSINSSVPANTHCLMGSLGNNNIYNDLNNSSIEDKNIVNDFINLFGANIGITIKNFNIDLFFDIIVIIPQESFLDLVFYDYNDLSNEDKLVVNKFVDLVISISK